jgi:predicted TIM-barrel enzyme
MSNWNTGRHYAATNMGHSSPSLAAKTTVLSFNSTQSMVIVGHLTGYNTLRRHVHLMGQTSSPLCMGCGTEDETSAHILCECEALASLIHTYLGSFFLGESRGH